MSDDLRIIKKYYGEKMMHLCRELFSTLLEENGLLSKLMLENFAPSRNLYDDIINSENVYKFKDYVYSLFDVEKKEIIVKKTPQELLSDAGYILYECKSEEDIQEFKKYYAKGEELCTFTQGGRLNHCHVFFAVKKNVDEIKRENFKYPSRQDEYGTSVISIQFSRGITNTLSIKNRYNHRVNNPDATFSNNLENIIPGLTESFKKYYRLNINQNGEVGFELPNYVRANDGRYYKYNYEMDNIYYCPNNIIIDNFKVKKYDKEKYIVLDYFILDLVNKEIKIYDDTIEDCFIEGITDIKNIILTKESENKLIEIETYDKNKIIIKIDKLNRIIEYRNEKLETVSNNFLWNNETLSILELPNLKETGQSFLYFNKELEYLNLPKLENVGDLFMFTNENLKTLILPNVQMIGNQFFHDNLCLKVIDLPKLKFTGHSFFRNNRIIDYVNLPNLESVDSNFLSSNNSLRKLELLNLVSVGNSFLFANHTLKILNLPKLQYIGDFFISSNSDLEEIYIPNLDLKQKFLLLQDFGVLGHKNYDRIYEMIIQKTKL